MSTLNEKEMEFVRVELSSCGIFFQKKKETTVHGMTKQVRAFNTPMVPPLVHDNQKKFEKLKYLTYIQISRLSDHLNRSKYCPPFNNFNLKSMDNFNLKLMKVGDYRLPQKVSSAMMKVKVTVAIVVDRKNYPTGTGPFHPSWFVVVP